MKAAVALKPSDAELQLFLGDLYLRSGDRDRAAQQYARLTKIDSMQAGRLYEAMVRGNIVNVRMHRK